jgi:hypothetical protein
VASTWGEFYHVESRSRVMTDVHGNHVIVSGGGGRSSVMVTGPGGLGFGVTFEQAADGFLSMAQAMRGVPDVKMCEGCGAPHEPMAYVCSYCKRPK